MRVFYFIILKYMKIKMFLADIIMHVVLEYKNSCVGVEHPSKAAF